MELKENGFRLKIKLLQERKTQTWFAKQLGISRQALTNYIYGESNYPLEQAIKLYIDKGVIDDTYKDRKRQR